MFNDTATTEIYTLTLHDALPISDAPCQRAQRHAAAVALEDAGALFVAERLGRAREDRLLGVVQVDRKSTRLNSSHANISYDVFCLKKSTSSRLAPIISPAHRL